MTTTVAPDVDLAGGVFHASTADAAIAKGRRGHREGDDRGLPDGMALQAIAVTRTYNEGKQGKDWRRMLAGHDLEPTDAGSFNHAFVAACCELLLGESNGSWLSRNLRRQTGGFVKSAKDGALLLLGWMGREFGSAEYPSYVLSVISACIAWARRTMKQAPKGSLLWQAAADLEAAAVAWGRQGLCIAALLAAPGTQGLDRGNALSPAVSLMVVGERTQGRPSSPMTGIFASAAGLSVDLPQLEHQVWCWPWRVFMSGAGPDLLTTPERGALRALALRGELAPVRSSTLWPVFESIRIQGGLTVERHAGGGMAWMGDANETTVDTDNTNSIATQAAAWGPGGLRHLVLDPNIRQHIPRSRVVTRVVAGVWRCEASNDAGRRATLEVNLATIGERLWKATIPPGEQIVIT